MEENIYKAVQEALKEQQQELQEQQLIQTLSERVDEIDNNCVTSNILILVFALLCLMVSIVSYFLCNSLEELEHKVEILEKSLHEDDKSDLSGLHID